MLHVNTLEGHSVKKEEYVPLYYSELFLYIFAIQPQQIMLHYCFFAI
jgi:hypothetical protein